MQIAILGLGRFGSELALTLADEGHEVLGIDMDEHEVHHVADSIAKAAIADITDEDALEELGVGSVTVGVVATADLEASVLATMNLMSLGIKDVYANAQNDRHATMLRRLGVQRVMQPEKEGGQRFAHLLRLHDRDVHDYLSVTKDYGIAVYQPPPRLYGTPLSDLDDVKSTRRLIMLVRNDEIQINPSISQEIQNDDLLIFSGDDLDLAKGL